MSGVDEGEKVTYKLAPEDNGLKRLISQQEINTARQPEVDNILDNTNYARSVMSGEIHGLSSSIAEPIKAQKHDRIVDGLLYKDLEEGVDLVLLENGEMLTLRDDVVTEVRSFDPNVLAEGRAYSQIKSARRGR